MKKRKLLVLGLFLFLIPFACNQREDVDSPVTEVGDSEDFDRVSAQAYFETNATDLAPLSFAEDVHNGDSRVEMVPQWENAMESANDEIRVVEVPIWSNSPGISTETVMENGKLSYQKFFLNERRLIITRYRNGEISMFVATVMPAANAVGNAEKGLKSFRYLGGGDFTGRVFCSTLDGRFVKAFGYTNGQPVGQVLVESRSGSIGRTTGDAGNYSVVSLYPEPPITPPLYPVEEIKPHPDLCPHQKLTQDCWICKNPCPDCKPNPCNCPQCYICEKKQKDCSCPSCPKCSKKGSNCFCPKCSGCNQALTVCKCPKCSKCKKVPDACTCKCPDCYKTLPMCSCSKCSNCKLIETKCKCLKCYRCDNVKTMCTCGKCPKCSKNNALCACPLCLICREKPARCIHNVSTRSQEGTARCDHDHNVPDPWLGSMKGGAEETVFFRHSPDC